MRHAFHGVVAVTLSHGSDHEPNKAWIDVDTQSPAGFAGLSDQSIDDRDVALAGCGSWRLFDVTCPELTAAARADYMLNALNFGLVLARKPAAWQQQVWRVDGDRVAARTFEFAGAWTGFATVGDLAIVVLASRLPPAGLTLASWPDTQSYGFDLARPMHNANTIALSRLAAFGSPEPSKYAWPLSPAHNQFLSG